MSPGGVVPAVHGTAVARWRGGAWRGVLLRGASGSGKSGLALAALEQGWRLVADDRTLVWASAGRVFGRAPATLTGLVEARGVGVLPIAPLRLAEIVLLVDLVAGPQAVERFPDLAVEAVAGVTLPKVSLWAYEGAAAAKLGLALAQALDSAAGAATALGAARQQAYQAPRAAEPKAGHGVSRGPPKRDQ